MKKSKTTKNRKCNAYKYKVGQMCLIIARSKEEVGKSLGFHHKGMYKIIKVNNNSTVQIKCGNFTETMKICRLFPYIEQGIKTTGWIY